jgi:hypothetical protein
LIRRRYSGQDIKSVDFDRFIEVTAGKEYLCCPIRVELEVGDLLGEKRGITTSLLRAVSCNDLRIATFALTADGEIKANKNASVARTRRRKSKEAASSGGSRFRSDRLQTRRNQRLVTSGTCAFGTESEERIEDRALLYRGPVGPLGRSLGVPGCRAIHGCRLNLRA